MHAADTCCLLCLLPIVRKERCEAGRDINLVFCFVVWCGVV
jgi:hypothetical protein